MDLLFEIFEKTPWWVYCFFVFFVLFGLRAVLKKRRRVHSVLYLLVLPSTLGIVNFVWLSERLHHHFYDLIFWVVGILIGTCFGWIMARSWHIEADPKHSAIILPRTPSTLVLLVLFFVIRYFFIYNYEIHPEAAIHLFMSDAITSGVMTGLFAGRALQIYKKYRKVL